MTNILNNLYNKQTHLLARKSKLKQEYEQQMAEIQHQIDIVTEAKYAIENAIQDLICPRCKGSGTIRVCDAAGDIDDETCSVCNGTGIYLGEKSDESRD